MRGMGIGKSLINACEDTARDNGYKDIYLRVEYDNSNAVNIYKRMGYEFIEEKKGRTGVMRRYIGGDN